MSRRWLLLLVVIRVDFVVAVVSFFQAGLWPCVVRLFVVAAVVVVIGVLVVVVVVVAVVVVTAFTVVNALSFSSAVALAAATSGSNKSFLSSEPKGRLSRTDFFPPHLPGRGKRFLSPRRTFYSFHPRFFQAASKRLRISAECRGGSIATSGRPKVNGFRVCFFALPVCR